MACDEYAIKSMSDSQRASYSQALLSCTANQHILAACPLAFGSKDVKKRIRAVLSYQKPRARAMVTAVALILVITACFMTSPKQDEEKSVQGNNDIDLNQTSILDVSQQGQAVSKIIDSGERQTKQEIESFLMREIIREQESLARTRSN